MSLTAWREEPIAKGHDRNSFDCGGAASNDYLRLHARKSHELGGSKTFLAVSEDEKKTVFGFYTLSPASVEYSRVPDAMKRGLARHDVPVFRLGRLAVHRTVQNKGMKGHS